MKVIAIGDTHGRDVWKKIVNKELQEGVDKIIFIGDYLDSLDPKLNGLVQTRNFSDIMEFRLTNPELTECLFGNHEFHYLSCCRSPYSGFQGTYSEFFRDMLESSINKRHLKMMVHINGYLFSHAGLSEIWCKNNDIDVENLSPDVLCDTINDLLYYTPRVFEFTMGRNFSDYGDDVTQSPIWIRRASLFQSAPLHYSQVVGHTPQKKMNRDLLQSDKELIFIDTIHGGKSYTNSEYLKITFDDSGLTPPITEYKKL
jgi:hypothetical protein